MNWHRRRLSSTAPVPERPPTKSSKSGRQKVFCTSTSTRLMRNSSWQAVCEERCMAKGRIVIDETLCKGCALCLSVCPKDLIQLATDRFTPKGYWPAEMGDPQDECTAVAISARELPPAEF